MELLIADGVPVLIEMAWSNRSAVTNESPAFFASSWAESKILDVSGAR